jgi:hypothetical protein
MKTIAGVWIDHRKAVVTRIMDDREETRVIESNVEKHAGRIDGVRSTAPYESQKVPADDSRQRGFTGHLHGYYDAIIAALGDADSILFFGPGEAKGELRSRLERDHLGGRIVAVETADKMTDRQITTKVRDYFRKESTTRS